MLQRQSVFGYSTSNSEGILEGISLLLPFCSFSMFYSCIFIFFAEVLKTGILTNIFSNVQGSSYFLAPPSILYPPCIQYKVINISVLLETFSALCTFYPSIYYCYNYNLPATPKSSEIPARRTAADTALTAVCGVHMF